MVFPQIFADFFAQITADLIQEHRRNLRAFSVSSAGNSPLCHPAGQVVIPSNISIKQSL